MLHLNQNFNVHVVCLVPRRSLLPRRPCEVWEGVSERTPSKYCQNTPDLSTKKPLVRFG